MSLQGKTLFISGGSRGGPSRTCTGNFFIDEEVLRADGLNESQPLAADFFIPDQVFERSPTPLKHGY